jgi:hypothetical protein
MSQVMNQCRTDILRQRHSLLTIAFASDNEFAGLPVEVIQCHGDHLSGSQTESRQKKQDREVALPCRTASVTAGEQSLYLLGREGRGQVRQPPIHHPWHRSSEVSVNCATKMQKAQKTAQCRDHKLGIAASNLAGTLKNESVDVLYTQDIKVRLIVAELVMQKVSHVAKVALHRYGIETALQTEETREVVLNTTQCGVVGRFGRAWCEAELAQISEQLPCGMFIAVSSSSATTTQLQKSRKAYIIEVYSL